LMAAACRCGAVLGGADPDRETALEGFGLDIGMAFQFVDDLLDYAGSVDEVGKAKGGDLKDGKLTLPLLHALKRAGPAEREAVMDVVLRDNKTAADFRQVFSFVARYDGIGEARNAARQRVEQAKNRLGVFPDGTAKEELLEVADFLTERRR